MELSSRGSATSWSRLAQTCDDSNPGSTSQWPVNAPSVKSGVMHNRYATHDKRFAPSALSSTRPQLTTTHAVVATLPMLTPNIVYIYIAPTVMAPTRPPVLPALGLSQGQTPLKSNGSTRPNAMRQRLSEACDKPTLQDHNDPCPSA
ncbi:hypothetical protein AX15_007731 [Amanita polypyramis BW_CC]|nr:hypothetical protein AX15_007731 [Amanita polypyramis BW_CC]